MTFNLRMEKPKPVKRTIACRNLKGVDGRNFACDIKKEATNIKQPNTGAMLGAFNSNLRAILDKHAPLRTRTVTHRPSAPWMNEQIKDAKQE
ncbi:ATP-dependent DNA helicase [Elysia marginata]|uniref:ATP-dependent DNA helicase n=1 Tax=Elysia marginata TaxID=1093978 RepID=A0AAV4JYK9_9GAST|nr:ATP-dependent DNA helicase [Elysia marginata]